MARLPVICIALLATLALPVRGRTEGAPAPRVRTIGRSRVCVGLDRGGTRLRVIKGNRVRVTTTETTAFGAPMKIQAYTARMTGNVIALLIRTREGTSFYTTGGSEGRSEAKRPQPPVGSLAPLGRN